MEPRLDPKSPQNLVPFYRSGQTLKVPAYGLPSLRAIHLDRPSGTSECLPKEFFETMSVRIWQDTTIRVSECSRLEPVSWRAWEANARAPRISAAI
jgi:hypothetical protein